MQATTGNNMQQLQHLSAIGSGFDAGYYRHVFSLLFVAKLGKVL